MAKRQSREHTRPAKISQPRAQAYYPRTRLFKLLDAARRHPIVWIAAAGGAGKTTLASSYLAARKLKTLWYQLDLRDADPATFFYYLREAARQLAPRKRETLRLLTPEYLLGLSVFARNFFEELFRRLPSSTVLVLDNYQEVPEGAPLHGLLAEALATIPDGMTVLVVSRAEPPPVFARLQAQGLISLLPSEELMLTLEEAHGIASLLKSPPLPPGMLTALHSQTRGWTAGLLLLLERVRHTELNDTSLPHIARDALFDYFAAELFQRTQPAEQDLLLKTALLPKINGSVADRLTGSPRATELLNGLARRNYFTIKHPGRPPAFEYHPLFREFLLTRANRTFDAGTLTTLREQAAALLEEDGQIEAAADLLSASGNLQLLAALCERHAARLVSQGRSRTLESWLRAIPDEVRDAKPSLDLWLGVCRLPFSPPESQRCFERAFARFQAVGNIEGSLRSLAGIADSIIYGWNEFSQADRWIRVLEDFFNDHAHALSFTLRTRALKAFFFVLALRQPQHPQIRTWHDRLVQALERDDEGRLDGYATLVLYYAWIGDHAAASLVVRSLQRIAASPDAAPMARITARIIEAVYHVRAAAHDDCERAIDNGLQIARDSGVLVWNSQLYSQRTINALSKGDSARAALLLADMEASLVESRRVDMCMYHYNSAWAASQRGENVLAKRHADQALSYARSAGTPFHQALSHAALAEILMDQAMPDAAEAHLHEALEVAVAMHSEIVRFMCLLSSARLALLRTENDRAREKLREAMTLGREKNYINCYFWRPDVIARLCGFGFEWGIEVEYVRKLVTSRVLAPPTASAEMPAWPWPVRIYTLGRFTIEVSGEPLTFGHKAQRRPLELLMVLIATGGNDVPVHRIAGALWRDADADAALSSMTAALHRLRKLLADDEAVILSQNRLTLNARKVWVDVWSFKYLLEDHHGSHERALALYRGEFLAADSDEPWALSMREQLRARFVRHASTVAAGYTAAGRHEDAVVLLERALEADPAAERLYRQLMQSHGALGQRSEALRTYDRCRHSLQAWLGVAPDGETEALRASLGSRESATNP